MNVIHHLRFRAMGCEVNMQVETEAAGDTILSQMPDRVEQLEATLSRFRPASELMQLNARAGEWVAVSEVLFEVIHAAKHAARQTEGLVNPLILPALIANGYARSFEEIGQPETHKSRPALDWRGILLDVAARRVRLPADSAIDLGGVAKGWVAARLTDELAEYGPCLVDLGGDMVASGAPQGYAGWPVEIEDPETGEAVLTVALKDAAIVTSGIDYRRWQTSDGQLHHHIIDPRTGYPAQTDVVSVTVVHPHAPTAEAYAKAVLLLGSQAGLLWLQDRWHAAGLAVRQDGAVLATNNFHTLITERDAL